MGRQMPRTPASLATPPLHGRTWEQATVESFFHEEPQTRSHPTHLRRRHLARIRSISAQRPPEDAPKARFQARFPAPDAEQNMFHVRGAPPKRGDWPWPTILVGGGKCVIPTPDLLDFRIVSNHVNNVRVYEH